MQTSCLKKTPSYPPSPPPPTYLKEKEEKTTTHSIVAKTIYLHYFGLLSAMGKVSWLLEGLESSFWGKNMVELNFQVIGAHYR